MQQTLRPRYCGRHVHHLTRKDIVQNLRPTNSTGREVLPNNHRSTSREGVALSSRVLAFVGKSMLTIGLLLFLEYLSIAFVFVLRQQRFLGTCLGLSSAANFFE